MSLQLKLETRPSPVGTMLIVTDDEGRLRALDFEDYEARMRDLLRLHYGAVELIEGSAPACVLDPIDAYFQGHPESLHAIPTHTGGTPFQRSVWQALMEIPLGGTESYGQMARRLGRPNASRAVGLANGSNPIAIVVPCHRVIGASGALTGYGGGLWRKKWLLAHERTFLEKDLFQAA
jgi:methylated-DNA-[protein]-cysteine S-methyltransferase